MYALSYFSAKKTAKIHSYPQRKKLKPIYPLYVINPKHPHHIAVTITHEFPAPPYPLPPLLPLHSAGRVGFACAAGG